MIWQVQHMYSDRYEELMNRTFLRTELANYIEHYMARFPKSEAVMNNIANLRKEDSVVVIGGTTSRFTYRALYIQFIR